MIDFLIDEAVISFSDSPDFDHKVSLKVQIDHVEEEEKEIEQLQMIKEDGDSDIDSKDEPCNKEELKIDL